MRGDIVVVHANYTYFRDTLPIRASQVIDFMNKLRRKNTLKMKRNRTRKLGSRGNLQNDKFFYSMSYAASY